MTTLTLAWTRHWPALNLMAAAMNDADRSKAFKAARALQLGRMLGHMEGTVLELERLAADGKAEIDLMLARSSSDFAAWQLPQLTRSIDQVLTELGEARAKLGGSAVTTGWQFGSDLIDQSLLAGGVNIASLLGELDTRQLLGIRTFMTERLQTATSESAAKVRSALGLMMIGVQDTSRTLERVAAALETSRSRALTITRTEVGRAYAVAGQERMVMAGGELPGLKKQWRRSGKIKSRFAHDLADGQIVAVDEVFTVNGHELLHPRDPAAPASETINCGCSSLPLMENWQVRQPARQAFSDQEIALNPRKRDLASALGQ